MVERLSEPLTGGCLCGGVRFEVTEPLVRAWRPESGFAKEFCSECGSQLWSRSPDDPEVISVRLGAFDGDPGIRPEHRQFVAYAASWEEIPDDGLPRYDERPPG